MSIEAMNGLVYLDEKTVKKTKGGIHLPEARRHAEEWATGVIVEIDAPYVKEFHKETNPGVGDTVVYFTKFGTPVTVNGQKLIATHIDRLMGITERYEPRDLLAESFSSDDIQQPETD